MGGPGADMTQVSLPKARFPRVKLSPVQTRWRGLVEAGTRETFEGAIAEGCPVASHKEIKAKDTQLPKAN